MQQRSNQKKGFNLIEAAVVLAVVGAVIGGIWVAAATMYENYKVNKAVEDLALIVKDIQGLISISNAAAIGNTNINSTLKEAMIYPKDWIINGSIKHPLNGYASIANDAGGFLWINLYSVQKSACIKLVVKISSLKTLRLMTIDSSTFVNFPVSSETAEGACIAPSQTITLSFNYTRTN